MRESDYTTHALTFVNLLVPESFSEAEKWISGDCTYLFQGQLLSGASIVNAFRASHEKAAQKLDSIEYLPGSIKEILPDGALVSVTDKISVNGNVHTYRDQLEIHLSFKNQVWKVIEIKHLPIAVERERLQDFLDSAGPKNA